jgi:hypothetical protein
MVAASVDRYCPKVNEREREKRERGKGVDMRAGRDGICSSCLTQVVEREAGRNGRESLKKSEQIERLDLTRTPYTGRESGRVFESSRHGVPVIWISGFSRVHCSTVT